MIYALSDTVLSIFQVFKGDPLQMLKKLDTRYASKTSASKITKISGLITLNYTSLRSDIPNHIDQMVSTIEQLKRMDMPIQYSFAVAILVASIEVTAFCPVTTAIIPLAETDRKWYTVAKLLTEDAKGLKEY